MSFMYHVEIIICKRHDVVVLAIIGAVSLEWFPYRPLLEIQFWEQILITKEIKKRFVPMFTKKYSFFIKEWMLQVRHPKTCLDLLEGQVLRTHFYNV